MKSPEMTYGNMCSIHMQIHIEHFTWNLNKKSNSGCFYLCNTNR